MLMETTTRLADFVRLSTGMPFNLRPRSPTMQAPASGCQPGRPQPSLKGCSELQNIWNPQNMIFA